MSNQELLDELRAYGADVDGALARCVNNEDLYVRLLGMFQADTGVDKLRAALDAGDLHEAFVAAHTMKGVAANLGLTPLHEALVAIVEPLRHEEAADYATLGAAVEKGVDDALAVIGGGNAHA